MTCLFVHMPKCAGYSVRVLLESLYPGKIIFDNVSHFRIPLSERIDSLEKEGVVILPDKSLVYGHFFPVRYLGKTLDHKIRLTTILRDPLPRMLSHYVYWNNGDFDHYLWRKMKAQNWSFADFAFCPEMQNFYTQYSIHVPLECYDYIGLYEDLNASIRRCCAVIGLALPENAIIPHANANVEKRDDLFASIDQNAFKQWHAADYAFYEAAKQRFHIL